MNVASRIKSRRKALGLSVDFVASKLGVNRTTIYRYESQDIEKMPTDIVDRIAPILETTPAYLMGWEDEPVENPNIKRIKEEFEKMLPALLDLTELEREKLHNIVKSYLGR